MCKIALLCVAGSVVLSHICAASSNSVWAAISANKPIFCLSRADEIDIQFAVVNDGTAPKATAEVRDNTVLIVNGKELKGSADIIAGGLRQEGLLQTGDTSLFLFRLTEFFREPGIYEVIWKGRGFETKPIVFRVVERPFQSAIGEEEITSQLSPIDKKLRTIILPEVKFDGAALESIVSFLIEESRRLDPERKGVNIVLTSSRRAKEINPKGTDDAEVAALSPFNRDRIIVTLNVRDICLRDVIRAIADQTGIRYRIETYGVVIDPSSKSAASK